MKIVSTNHSRKLIGIELFSGCGGMSLGASMAGVDVKIAVELNKITAATYKINHRETKVINDDVANIESIDIKKGSCATVLFGGPPCQGFSISNLRTRNSLNPKNWQFKEFIRVAKLWMPDWVVIENVSGLLKTESGLFLDMILEDLIKLGYTVSYQVLNAVEYGVPQKRERLFIIGSLHGVTTRTPIKSERKFTVYEAIGDLPVLSNGGANETLNYASENHSLFSIQMRGKQKKVFNNGVSKNNDLVVSRYSHIPQGGNWSNIPERLMENYTDRTRCHGGIYHRLKENDASVVIGNYRKNMLIHPIQNRGLSVREAARLQSFPDSYIFQGNLTEQQQQVGDAVPPKLAEAVFRTITEHL